MSDFFDFPHRVTYAETDKMGFVYYANYLVLFEIGRTELIRAAGRTYLELEDAGFNLPVVEAVCRYKKPGRYDDLLTILTRVTEFKGIRLDFEYEIVWGGEVIAEGTTKHAFVDSYGRPRKLTPDMKGFILSLT